MSAVIIHLFLPLVLLIKSEVEIDLLSCAVYNQTIRSIVFASHTRFPMNMTIRMLTTLRPFIHNRFRRSRRFLMWLERSTLSLIKSRFIFNNNRRWKKETWTSQYKWCHRQTCLLNRLVKEEFILQTSEKKKKNWQINVVSGGIHVITFKCYARINHRQFDFATFVLRVFSLFEDLLWSLASLFTFLISSLTIFIKVSDLSPCRYWTRHNRSLPGHFISSHEIWKRFKMLW